MPQHRSPRRSSRYLLAAIALLLVWSLPAGPAAAHTFTRNDANDSASKIDLRSVSVSHTSTSVVHSVRTWNSWTPASLQHDSFFLIGINKDNDAAYERCAFIYYTNRLRGQLSNCGAQFIRYLHGREGERHDREDHDPQEPDRPGVRVVRGELLGRGEAVSQRVSRLRAQHAPGHPPRPQTVPWLPGRRPPMFVCGRIHVDDLLLPVLRLRCAQRGRFVERATASVRDVVERRFGLGRRAVQSGPRWNGGDAGFLSGSSGR